MLESLFSSADWFAGHNVDGVCKQQKQEQQKVKTRTTKKNSWTVGCIGAQF